MQREEFLFKGEKITCNNESQMYTVLKILENEGFVWINGGERPTEWLPYEKIVGHTFPDSINWHSDGKICRGNYPTGKEWQLEI